MNYFELHLGDYEAATAHLSMLEDAAYCRMLRIYYRTEKPLPADVKQVCRLVRATSKPERDAVQQVLSDFFTLGDDGWHQARCDEEIQRFREGEPEREAKRANEETRLKRHREERAALFRVLTDAGQHAPWNTKIEELRRLAAPYQARSATGPETNAPPLPATAPATPATATHGNVSPDTNPQTPDTSTQTPGFKSSEPIGSGASAPLPGERQPPDNPDPGAAPAPVDVIFALGLPVLAAAQVPERQARSFLGLLRKEAKGRGGDPFVVAAIERCIREKPLQPLEFLRGCFKPPAPGGGQPELDDLTAAVQRRLGITPGDSRQETIDA